MNKLMLILLVLVISAINPSVGSAQQTVFGEYDYITKVNVGEDNYLYLTVRGNFAGDHNCANLAFVRSQYLLSDDRTKAWLQIATASFLSRAKVHIWTRGCIGPGNSSYPIMVKMQMFQ